MRIQFDAEQAYQKTAVKSVVRLFEGLEKYEREYKMDAQEIVANLPEDDELWESSLLDNLNAVQMDNGIEPNRDLDIDEGDNLMSLEPHRFPSFNIEMETGTGKTYIYFRTVYELYRTYGFNKFIIVVPSVAIYQGVKKTFEITRQHFNGLYDKPIVHLTDYDGGNVAVVKNFAVQTSCEVLLITLDSFNKKSNTLYKETDKLPGSPLLAYEYLQRTRPILILDEPQNMDSDTARKALRTLNPLLALRYSATHKSVHNLLYRLTPIEAFRQGLVKRIQVGAITEDDNYNGSFIALLEVKAQAGSTPRAVVQTLKQVGSEREMQNFTLKINDKLQSLTNMAEHEDYVVRNISGMQGDEFIEFSNEISIRLNETVGSSRPAVFRAQIRQTINEHFNRQNALLGRGIKVLSLFFIDRVANYTDADNGIIRQIFDQEYELLRQNNAYFKDFGAEEVRDAYFSSYKKKVKGGTEQTYYVEDENAGDSDAKKAQKASFELIMKNKELLLTLPNRSPNLKARVCFIFAHSALKEGWDNPNVFQICTLNQTISDRKKRQEIGRGLRLSVNQEGERIADETVNILTVIPNESYESYVSGLQRDYKSDGRYSDSDLPPRPSRKKLTIKRNDEVFNHPDFKQFWLKLSKNVSYKIDFEIDVFVKDCLNKLRTTKFPMPSISIKKGEYVQTEVKILFISANVHQARLRIELEDTRRVKRYYEGDFEIFDDLSEKITDTAFKKFLKDFQLHTISPEGYNPSVKFSNGYETSKFRPLRMDTELGILAKAKTMNIKLEEYHPVFDVISRTANETKLTKKTILKLFEGVLVEQRQACTLNPEGFTEKFIGVIKNELAKHIAERLIFEVIDERPEDLNNMFPIDPKFVQERLKEAGKNSIYNLVQVDSDVEEQFVEDRIKNQPNVLFYFKFPRRFKIDFPKIIHDYNPDWGIMYRDNDKQLKIELVRETKGTVDKAAMRFESEGLKITCAERYFKALGIDYRHVTDKTEDWYEVAK